MHVSYGLQAILDPGTVTKQPIPVLLEGSVSGVEKEAADVIQQSITAP
jgi:hypothetical protein